MEIGMGLLKRKADADRLSELFQTNLEPPLAKAFLQIIKEADQDSPSRVTPASYLRWLIQREVKNKKSRPPEND